MSEHRMAETPEMGGPAFPSVGEGFGNPKYSAPGMALRDWFAGQALNGILAGWPADMGLPTPHIIARDCMAYADAMLEARDG